MSDEFWNAIRGQIANLIAQVGQPRMGVVQNVDAGRGVVRVSWDENGTLSGWLPIAQQAVGNGWSVGTLPLPGTQVFVAPDMGDLSHGVVLGAVHSQAQPPGGVIPYGGTAAQPLTPGEPTLRHASGASIRLMAGGRIEMHGDVFVDGNLTVSKDIHATGAIIAGFGGADQIGLQTHIHPSAPNPPTPGT